jgi:hypothetical protein
MENRYFVKRDLTILNPEMPEHHGPVSFVRAAFEAFADGRAGWKLHTEQRDDWDGVAVTLFSEDDAMSIDDRNRWHEALQRYGLKGE